MRVKMARRQELNRDAEETFWPSKLQGKGENAKVPGSKGATRGATTKDAEQEHTEGTEKEILCPKCASSVDGTETWGIGN
jgi:hypothetical protein